MSNDVQLFKSLLEGGYFWEYNTNPDVYNETHQQFWRTRLLWVIQCISRISLPSEVVTHIYSFLEINHFLFSVAYQLARYRFDDMRILAYITGSPFRVTFTSMTQQFNCCFLWIGFSFDKTIDLLNSPKLRFDVSCMKYYKLGGDHAKIFTFGFNLIANSLADSLYMVENTPFPYQAYNFEISPLIDECIRLHSIEKLSHDIMKTNFLFDYASMINYPAMNYYPTMPELVAAPEIDYDDAWYMLMYYNVKCPADFPMPLAEFIYSLAVAIYYPVDLVFIVVGEIYYRIGATCGYSRLGIYEIDEDGCLFASQMELKDFNDDRTLRAGTVNDLLDSQVLIKSDAYDNKIFSSFD